MKSIRRTTSIRRQARQLQLLQELGHAIAALEVGALLDRLVQHLHASLGYQIVAIALVRGDSLVFRSAAVPSGTALPPLPDAIPLDGPGLTTWAARNAQPVLVGDVASDPRYFDQGGLGEIRSELVLPLRDRFDVLGIIDIQSNRPNAFDRYDLELMTTVAEYTAVAVKNALLYEAEQERRRELETLYQTERLLVADMEQSYNELLVTLSELELRDQQLRRSERLNVLGELASGVAHDFNNLLVGIMGNAELLLADEADTERRRALSVIEQAAHDGAAIVRRIQEFARQGERQGAVPIDLGDVIEGALAITRPRWHNLARRDGRDIVVRRDIHPVPPVLGSAAELRELLINLILNAVDAMPDGGELLVRLSLQHPRPGDTPEPLASAPMALVEVRDSGVGISPEQQERVFEIFYSTKPAGKGSGLGLAISRQIIARHGGRLELESALGQGSTFRVLLPLAEQAPVELSVPSLAPANLALRVLVVDDDPAVRDVLARILKRDGHQVSALASAEEAIAQFIPGAYDMLFTDLSLSGMDGATLLSRLRAADPRLIAVIVTGWGQQVATAQLSAHASAVVTKPFNIAQIRQLIGELTRRDAV
jgi:signal transduction histidine kinase